MPKFLYTIILAAVLLWGLCLKILTSVKPDSFFNILLFLVPLFFALALTLSVPFYFYFFKFAPTFTNLKNLYRRSLKWSVFFALGMTIVVSLKVFAVLNVINFILFCILYYAIYSQLKH